MDPARTQPLTGQRSGSELLDRLLEGLQVNLGSLLGRRQRICWGKEGKLLVHLGGAQSQAHPLYLLGLTLQEGSATARPCQVLRATP